MLKKQDQITIKELKTYLYSLEKKKQKEEEFVINKYKTKCEINARKIKDREIQKIKKSIEKKYKEMLETKDEILVLLEECQDIPKAMEKINVAQYMAYRAEVKKAGNILKKAEKRIGRRYNEIVYEIEKELDAFPELDDIEEIDFSVYKPDASILEKAKEEFKEEYTEEEKRALVQNEIDIVARAKAFNTIPIPHEILKNSDKDIQSKMQKFNHVRQRRLKILATMEGDYERLEIPREIDAKIQDAITNLDTLGEVLTKAEYNKAKNSLIKKKKKIYRSTSELRNIIKTKEKKTGIVGYNVQAARYSRMEALRNIINEANSVIKLNSVPGAEEQLKKLRASYEREKQYAAVLEKLEKEAGNDVTQNLELKAYRKQIEKLEFKINNSNKVTEEQRGKITKAKKELIILWKMEIDTTISKKQERLELLEEANENTQETKEMVKQRKSFFSKLRKAQNGDHVCV